MNGGSAGTQIYQAALPWKGDPPLPHSCCPVLVRNRVDRSDQPLRRRIREQVHEAASVV